MEVDLLLETFGSSWQDMREGALAAEEAGFAAVWVNDHLAGSVGNAPYVLECWTVLSALAAEVPRIGLGPLVLNVANRDPGTLAVMAATLQHVSGGRLLLGIGAGAQSGTPYAIEQEALGRRVRNAVERRSDVEQAITMLRRVWSGVVPPATGFLRPVPVPPIVVGARGPKMADLAGRVGDGICVSAGPAMAELIANARHACAGTGRDPQRLLVIVSLSSWPEGTGLTAGMDVDRLIIYVAPPFREAITRVGAMVGH